MFFPENIYFSPDGILSGPAKDQEPIPSCFTIGITDEVNGAGSSSTAQALADILGLCREDPGFYRRQMAVDLGYAQNPQDDEGIARFELEYASIHPKVDWELDRLITEKAQAGCLIEGKAAVILAKAGLQPICDNDQKQWQTVPIHNASSIPVFSILLTCDERVAAQRILQRKNKLRENIDHLEFSEAAIDEQVAISDRRMAASLANWNKLYHLSELRQEKGAFNLTVDTTSLSPDEVVRAIIENFVSNPGYFPLLSREQRQRLEEKIPGIQAFYPKN